LKPLLGKYGNEPNLRLIMFVLDETTYARELGPMAFYWTALIVGPPCWFHVSPHRIRLSLTQVVETAGLYNLSGVEGDIIAPPATTCGVARSAASSVAGWARTASPSRPPATWPGI